MTALRFVALDLSSAGTGVAWNCNHHGRESVGCRTVHSRWGADRPHDRIHDILTDIAAAVKCKPHLVVVEGGSYGSAGNQVDQLAGLRWVVRHWLWAQKLPYVEVAPGTVKVWATGSGATSGDNKVTKQAVREAITATYGRLCHVADHNQADAVSMLTLACRAYGQPLALVTRQQQTRALAAVKWPDLASETGPVVPAVTR